MAMALGDWIPAERKGIQRRDKRNDSSTGAEHGIWLVLHLRPRKKGSLEQQLLALADGLACRGLSLTLVFSEPPKPWLMHELDLRGVKVRTLPFSRPYTAAMELLALLREARPTLVHFHFLRATSPLVAAARLAGARVVLHDHITPVRAHASRLYEVMKKARDLMWNPLVDLRVAVSDVVADSVTDVEHVDRRRVVTVENGIDTERFEQADGAGIKTELDCVGKPLLVCVSRLKAEKGVESAVRALPLVGRDAVLALVGEGPEEVPLRELAAELRITDRVRFLGVRDDVDRILAASDVVVVPSHWEEAFGLAVVEGMAAGKPVVVSQSGAMPEIVGATGVVVPKKDPPALAAAITRLLDDPLLCTRLGRIARARARGRYGMRRWVEDMVAVYEPFCTHAVKRTA
jgi:glycosyltransferase involved in cell wall biosynthesis